MINLPTQAELALFAAKHGARIAKYALVVVLFIGYSGGLYYLGKRTERLHVAEKEVAAVVKQATEIKKEMVQRGEVVEKKAIKRAVLESDINQRKKTYEKAVEVAGPKPSCDLTPDELRELTEIIRSGG